MVCPLASDSGNQGAQTRIDPIFQRKKNYPAQIACFLLFVFSWARSGSCSSIGDHLNERDERPSHARQDARGASALINPVFFLVIFFQTFESIGSGE
jgi:hypothetical protein